MQQKPIKAPEVMVAQWVNREEDITLSGLLGKVVVVEAFQKLCPACVSQALPQAKRIVDVFKGQEVVVLGLHTVFEHHAAHDHLVFSFNAWPLGGKRVQVPAQVDCKNHWSLTAATTKHRLRKSERVMLRRSQMTNRPMLAPAGEFYLLRQRVHVPALLLALLGISFREWEVGTDHGAEQSNAL